MTIKKIVSAYLIEHGYDGLYNVCRECSCKTDDLMPCDNPSEWCAAGHLVECDEDHFEDDFCIGE